MQDGKTIFPVIKIDYSSDVNEFIASWKKLYDYKDYEEVYKKLLRKNILEPEDLYNLLNGKMGWSSVVKRKRLTKKLRSI